jgi:rhodanese-related sulfurtransferase
MNTSSPIIDVDREALKQGLSDGSILLIDVREAHEYAAGHIPHAISMPLSSFDPTQLPHTDKRIVFSCNSGQRTLRALALAQAEGFDLHEHYKGSFQEWRAAGEPIEQD